MTFRENKNFFNSDFRNGTIKYQLVTLTICAMFHLQTTEIQTFKVECFLMKHSNFNMLTYLSVTSRDSGILFSMCDIAVMSIP